jgi:putative SOS response-associated peptidase YedK
MVTMEKQRWLASVQVIYNHDHWCKPYPDDKMEAFQVSAQVNSTVIKGVINNKPELMLPLNSQ